MGCEGGWHCIYHITHSVWTVLFFKLLSSSHFSYLCPIPHFLTLVRFLFFSLCPIPVFSLCPIPVFLPFAKFLFFSFAQILFFWLLADASWTTRSRGPDCWLGGGIEHVVLLGVRWWRAVACRLRFQSMFFHGLSPPLRVSLSMLSGLAPTSVAFSLTRWPIHFVLCLSTNSTFSNVRTAHRMLSFLICFLVVLFNVFHKNVIPQVVIFLYCSFIVTTSVISNIL